MSPRTPIALTALLLIAAFARAEARTAFPVRIVEMSGDPDRADTRAHVRFCRAIGFNALWVHSREAGVWTKEAAPAGPELAPSFLRLARWCRRNGMEVWLSLDPGADTRERFVFSDEDSVRRLLKFSAMVREKAGVRHVVLSFDDPSVRLRELSDIFEYGASAAAAQFSLARRLASSLPRDTATWLRASTHCDAHLGDGTTTHGKSFLDGVGSLPLTIGIVWTGPTTRSPTITRADLEAAQRRMGGRPLLLDDAFPANNNDQDDAMALLLGSLRGREAGIRDVVAGYLARPSHPLAGSRLALLTTARFLADPDGYDPWTAASAATAYLAGRDRGAGTALTTQQLEWGGFMEGRNYWPRDALNPAIAANRIDDPAFVDSFTWTVTRYPGRMAALAHVANRAFRLDLLRMMRRRLAIARAMPLAIEYLSRRRDARPDAAEALVRIEEERRYWRADSDASRVLELFLDAALIPNPGPVP